MKQNGKTSQAEFRAIIAIAIILVLAIAFPSIKEKFAPSSKGNGLDVSSYSASTQSENEQRIASADNDFNQNKYKQYEKRKPYSNDYKGRYVPKTQSQFQQPQIKCSEFDPNSVTIDELQEMGVSSYVANNLMKYRSSGATFRKAEDVRKIYGIDSILFSMLEPCIKVTASAFASQQRTPTSNIDINTADIEAWKSLPGIGETFAKRIIAYRENLGGFHSVNQVGETYGLPPETLEVILPKLMIYTAPRKLNMNTATVEALAAHPYITHRQAETIVNYRNNHGKFAKPEDMLKIYSLHSDWLLRMQAYITCGDEGEDASNLVVR